MALPTGVFTEVDFGSHENWAREYILKHHYMSKEKMLKENRHNCGDYLVYKLNWCLLHSPLMQAPTVQYKNLTNAQRDFLYDYFLRHNLPDRANEIFAKSEKRIMETP